MKKVIYVLEDEQDILEVITLTLEENGYQVFSFNLAADFKQAINDTKPDLVLMDVALGNANGIVISDNLKLDRSTRHIPVILITANPEIDKIKLRSRADGFLAKPFDLENLLSLVSRNLSSSGETR